MEKVLIAEGMLMPEEIASFVDSFAKLEVKEFCEISLKFNDEQSEKHGACLVGIVAYTEYGMFFLRDSLTEGLLHRWGWDKKLHLQEAEIPDDISPAVIRSVLDEKWSG